MENEDIVYFDTEKGAQLFDGADTKGHFWTICRYFVSEKFLTYCGIASSVTVLNSLGVEAPDEPQIFPYKMFTQDNIFTDEVLHHRRPLEVEKGGNTLEQLASILSALHVQVDTYFAGELGLDDCREVLVTALKSPSQRVIVDFDRKVLASERQRTLLAAGCIPHGRGPVPVDGRGPLQIAAVLGEGRRLASGDGRNRRNIAKEPRIPGRPSDR